MKKTFLSSAIVSVLMVTSAMGMESMSFEQAGRDLLKGSNGYLYKNSAGHDISNWKLEIVANDCQDKASFTNLINGYKSEIQYDLFDLSTQQNFLGLFNANTNVVAQYNASGAKAVKLRNNRPLFEQFIDQLRPYRELELAIKAAKLEQTSNMSTSAGNGENWMSILMAAFSEELKTMPSFESYFYSGFSKENVMKWVFSDKVRGGAFIAKLKRTVKDAIEKGTDLFEPMGTVIAEAEEVMNKGAFLEDSEGKMYEHFVTFTPSSSDSGSTTPPLSRTSSTSSLHTIPEREEEKKEESTSSVDLLGDLTTQIEAETKKQKDAEDTLQAANDAITAKQGEVTDEKAVTVLDDLKIRLGNDGDKVGTSSSSAGPSLFARIDALGVDGDTLKTQAEALKKALDEQDTTPHEKKEADPSDPESKAVEAFTVEQIVEQVKKHVETFYTLEKDILTAELNQAKTKAEDEAKQLRADWIAQFGQAVKNLRSLLGTEGKKAPESDPSAPPSEPTLWQRFDALGTEGEYQGALRTAFEKAETEQKALENAVADEGTTNADQPIALTTMDTNNKLLIEQRDTRLKALESALDAQEKAKAAADELAVQAEKLRLFKEEKAQAVQDLLDSQELADLQAVVNAFPKPTLLTPSTAHSSATSADSSEVDTYAVFEALGNSLAKFKAELKELKKSFENLTVLAEAAKKPADSSTTFVPTSGNLEQYLEEGSHLLTYEEGTLAYDIAQAEYELLRGQQLDLNARILAQKRLREFASEASNPQQLDEHFKSEESSTQKFQKQFGELGSALKSVADSVEAEFSEERGKLQEAFEKSLYYRNILQSKLSVSEKEGGTSAPESQKVLLENLTFTPFDTVARLDLSGEYPTEIEEGMSRDSSSFESDSYSEDDVERSKRFVSGVSLPDLLAVNLLVQRLRTTPLTLGTSGEGSSSTTTGAPLSGADAEALSKANGLAKQLQLQVWSAERAQQAAERRAGELEKQVKAAEKELEEQKIRLSAVEKEKIAAKTLVSQMKQENKLGENAEARISEYNLALNNQLSISKEEVKAAKQRITSLTQLLETERTAFEAERNALLVPISSSLASIYTYVSGIINTPAAADLVEQLDKDVKLFVEMLYGTGASSSLKLREDLAGINTLKTAITEHERAAREALARIKPSGSSKEGEGEAEKITYLPKDDEVVSGNVDIEYSAAWFAKRHEDLGKEIDQLSEAAKSAKASRLVTINSRLQQITSELTQLATSIEVEKAKKAEADRNKAEIERLKKESEDLKQQMEESFNVQKAELQKKVDEASAASGAKVDPAVSKMLQEATEHLEKLAENANQRLDAVTVEAASSGFKSESYIADFLKEAEDLRAEVTEASSGITLVRLFNKQSAMAEAQKKVDEFEKKSKGVKSWLDIRRTVAATAKLYTDQIAQLRNDLKLLDGSNSSYSTILGEIDNLDEKVKEENKLDEKEAQSKALGRFKSISDGIGTTSGKLFNAVKEVAIDAQTVLVTQLDALNTSIEELPSGDDGTPGTKEDANKQVESIKAAMTKAISDANTATGMKTVAESLAPGATFAQQIEALQQSINDTLEANAKTQAETELVAATNGPKQTIAEARVILDDLANITAYATEANGLIVEYNAINQGLTAATTVAQSSEKATKLQEIIDLTTRANKLKQNAQDLQQKKTDADKEEQERLKHEHEEQAKKEGLEKQKQEVQKVIDDSTAASTDVTGLRLNLSERGSDDLEVQNPLQNDYLAKLTAEMNLISSDVQYALEHLDEGQGRVKNLHALRVAVANQMKLVLEGTLKDDEKSEGKVAAFAAAYQNFIDKSAELIAAASTTEAHDEEPPRADESATPPPAETPKAEEEKKEEQPKVEEEEKKKEEEQAEDEGKEKAEDHKQQDLSDDDTNSENRDDLDGPHSSTTGGGTGPNPITFETLDSAEAVNRVVAQLDEVDPSILEGKENTIFKGGKKTLSLKTAEEETYKAWTTLLNSISSKSADLTESALKSLGDTTVQNALDRARAVLAIAGGLLANEDFLSAREAEAKAMYEAYAAAINVVLAKMPKKGME